MDARQIERLIDEVKDGAMPRRDFVRRMLALGLTVPMAGMMLSSRGVAWAQSENGGHAYKPTKAGGGGALKLLFWQAPTLLNPHFAVGTRISRAAASSTSRSPPGTSTRTSCRFSPRRRLPSTTARSQRTAAP